MEKRAKNKHKELWVNLGVLSATLVLIVIAGEIFLRITMIQPVNIHNMHLHQQSSIPDLVYEFIPSISIQGYARNTVTIGSHGFRSPEIDLSKPTIAMLGDSFVYGWGVNDDKTNPAYLQEHFPHYNVVNAGVNGYNIEQEMIVYREKIASLNPALVVLQFTFNDADRKGFFDPQGLMRVGHKTEEELEQITRESITRSGLINFPGKYFLEKNSAIFKFVERKTKWLPFRKSVVDIHTETFGEEKIAMYRKWFTQLSHDTQGKNRLFVIWPEAALHKESRIALHSMAKEHGWEILDLYDHFGNGYKSFGWDYHPHPSTHKQAADLMAETIIAKGLL